MRLHKFLAASRLPLEGCF